MPFYVIHAGTTLQKCSVDGALTALVLPAGVTVVDTRPARMALLDRMLFICNAVSKNVIMDGDLSMRLAGLAAPAAAVTLAVGAAGDLHGKYYAAYTYAIKSGGKVVCESPLSPFSAQSDKLEDQQLAISNITVSPDSAVNCRRIYRSASGGGGGASSLYLCHEIDDNTTTSYNSNELDADLDPLPVSLSDLGLAPGTTTADRLKLVTEWKQRLWGVGTDNIDNLRWSGEKAPWAWKATNMFPIGPVGEDSDGITGFVRRRDELGVARRRVFWKVVGSNSQDFRVIKVVEGTGIWSTDSVVVVRDVGFFQGEDGVYSWSPDGVINITDDQVAPWFKTDDFFNRALFSSSFARYNQRWGTYELHLAAAGSTVLDRWVMYDIRRKAWYGPHKTDAFTPTCGGLVEDGNGLARAVLGSSDGAIYVLDQTTFSDDGTAIAFDVKLRHHCNTPDIVKYFGDMSIHGKQKAAGTVTITPALGQLGLDGASIVPMPANDSSDILWALTSGRLRLRRIGTGAILDLRFRNQEDGREVEIYGYEIPFHEFGRR